MTTFNGNDKDLASILISAERYALGRSTYIVSWTCDIIKNNLQCLSENDINVLIHDIENATNYGMYIDEEQWMDLKDKLKDLLNGGN